MTDRADRRGNAIAGTVLAAIVLLGGAAVALFTYAEDLFGSDAATIDEYNRMVLDSCDLAPDASLVMTFVSVTTEFTGDRVRSTSDVYASSQGPAAVGDALGVDVGYEGAIAAGCRFDQHPGAWVVAIDEVPATFWGDADAETVVEREIPAGTRTLFRLRLGQVVREGLGR